MIKHYVTFLSPGTMVSESSTQEVKVWDVELAKKQARQVIERYGAAPYAFYFTTRERGPDDFDSKEAAKSNLYYLGGVVVTLEEIEKRDDPKEEILRWNMRINKWDRMITNNNSWRVTMPLNPTDVILDWTP